MSNITGAFYKGVRGVRLINSQKPGKNLGIFSVTHGNEPIGIDISNHLINNFGIEKKLKVGKIFFIAINIEAYEKYTECGDISKYRFIDDNMNRISNQAYKKSSAEFQRLKDLRPIFNEIDCVLDIHNLTQGNDYLAISDVKVIDQAKKIFGPYTILVDNLAKTGSIVGEFLRNGKQAYGVEFASYNTRGSFEKGLITVLSFLEYHHVLERANSSQEIINQNVFEFISTVHVETGTFKYLYEYTGFTHIKPDEIFAFDGDKGLSHGLGENIYLGIVTKRPKKGDGAGFLFKKIQ